MEKLYKINNLLFYPAKMQLVSKQNAVQLKPKAAEVLLLFCLQPHKLISREQLLDSVWAGQIVTDNAINQVITQLRKVLHGVDPGSEFIVTMPRQGYKMVARVTEVLPGRHNRFGIRSRTFILVLLFLSLVSIYFIKDRDYEQQTSSITNVARVTALTHSKQAVFNPDLSFDGQYLAFTQQVAQDKSSLYVKQMSSEALFKLSPDQARVGGSAWALNSLKLVYFYQHRQQCQIVILDLALGPKSADTELRRPCFGSDLGQIAFSHDEKSIVFSAREETQSPYLLYSMSLSNAAVLKLSQPDPYNAGHISFDMHPKQHKLLLSTPNKQQKMSYYELALEQGTYRHLFAEPFYNCCAIWSHHGDKIISMGTYPASEFIEMDLDGKNRRSIYSSDSFVGPLKRAAESGVYLYQKQHRDIDIHRYDFSRQQTAEYLFSTQQELLPDIAATGNTLVYLTIQGGVLTCGEKASRSKPRKYRLLALAKRYWI